MLRLGHIGKVEKEMCHLHLRHHQSQVGQLQRLQIFIIKILKPPQLHRFILEQQRKLPIEILIHHPTASQPFQIFWSFIHQMLQNHLNHFIDQRKKLKMKWRKKHPIMGLRMDLNSSMIQKFSHNSSRIQWLSFQTPVEKMVRKAIWSEIWFYFITHLYNMVHNSEDIFIYHFRYRGYKSIQLFQRIWENRGKRSNCGNRRCIYWNIVSK